ATLALALAKALNCRQPDPPCDACSTCRRIDAGKHSDVERVQPGGICDESEHDHSADTSRDIRICQVRRAERVLGIAPFEGGRRVLILDPADALNQQSADAFLKTLEEPPNGAVLVLVTADEGALVETIRSRCRRVDLRALPVAETERALVERFDAAPEQAARLARLFGGRIGQAVLALRDPDFDARRAAMVDLAMEVATSGLVDRFTVAERLADAYSRRDRPPKTDGSLRSTTSADGETPAAPPADGKARGRVDVFAALDLWIEWWRDLLLVAGGADAVIVNKEHATELHRLAPAFGVEGAFAGIVALREARRDLEQNINPRLALEALMLRLPRVGNREQDAGNKIRTIV
ncbi:MAG: ATP-binding protein, partial [Dehalococcoidia bacterium]